MTAILGVAFPPTATPKDPDMANRYLFKVFTPRLKVVFLLPVHTKSIEYSLTTILVVTYLPTTMLNYPDIA